MKYRLYMILLGFFLLMSCSPSFSQLVKVMGDPNQFSLLLEDVENLDRRYKDGYTLLNKATLLNHVEAVEILLQRGADPTVEHNFHKNALETALQFNYEDIVKLIFLYRPDLIEFQEEGETFIREALWHVDDRMIKILLDNGLSANHRFHNGYSLLREAGEIKQNNKKVILTLLAHGANPNGEEQEGKTSHFYFYNGMDNELASALKEAGANFNHLDDQGNSSAFYYALNGKVSTVIHLLEQGMKPESSFHVMVSTDRSFTVESREWVFHYDRLMLPGQEVRREDVTRQESVTEQRLVPLLEYAKTSDHPHQAVRLAELGYSDDK